MAAFSQSVVDSKKSAPLKNNFAKGFMNRYMRKGLLDQMVGGDDYR